MATVCGRVSFVRIFGHKPLSGQGFWSWVTTGCGVFYRAAIGFFPTTDAESEWFVCAYDRLSARRLPYFDRLEQGTDLMAKPHRRLKKANHGARPANSKARRLKRAKVRT